MLSCRPQQWQILPSGGGAALIEFRIGDSIIKTVTLEIPEGEESILLPADALPTEEETALIIARKAEASTDSVIAGSDPQSLTNQILGWTDTKDETKTVYTTDESLYGIDGYAPIGEFIVSGDATFSAITEGNKDEIAGQARNDAVGDDSSAVDTAIGDDSSAAVIASEAKQSSDVEAVDPASSAGTVGDDSSASAIVSDSNQSDDGASAPVIASEAKQSSDVEAVDPASSAGTVDDDSSVDVDDSSALVIAASEPQSHPDELVDLLSLFTFPIVKFISALATVIPGISDEYKVTFEVEGDTYEEVTVAKDQPCPSVINPTSTGKVFTGWVYTDDSDELNPVEKTFNFAGTLGATTITGNLTVTATFTDNTHKVYFMSADPVNDTESSKAFVLYTDEVADGTKTNGNAIDFPDAFVPTGKVFSGDWNIQGEENNFDFNTLITEDIVLIPQLDDGYQVRFVSGGTVVEPQVIASGAYADEPDSDPAVLYRTGYDFVDWYELLDDEHPEQGLAPSPFDFTNTPITKTTTLYGKWTPLTSNYRVVYWLEKPGIVSDSGHGQPLSLAQRSDTNNYELAYVEPTFRNELTGTSKTMIAADIVAGAKTAMNNILVNTNAAIEPFDFDHSETAIINGANTSVINVYYTRAIYELKFQLSYPSGRSVANTDVGLTINNKTYTPEDNSSDPYIFYAKVGENVEDVWPFITYVYANDKVSENPVAYFIAWYFGGSVGRGAGEPVFQSLYLDGLASNVRTAVFTVRAADWVVGPLYPCRLHYMGESFIQESGDGRILYNNGKYYEEFEHLDFSIDTANALHAIPKNGYTGIGVTYIVSAGIYRVEIRNPATTGTNNLFITRPTNSPVIPDQYGFYDRQSYKLTFDTQGGDAIAGYTGASKIPYEMPLADYEPATPSRGFDEFLGWYEDSNYFVPFSFDGSVGQPTTMPYKDLTLYAKWLEHPHNVTFYADSAGTFEVTDFAITVANGGFISDPGTLDPEDWGRDSTDEFIGWYVKTSGGALVPYSWDVPVEDDLSLYARWNPPYTPHHITYDTDGGGTAPIDTTAYSSGSKAVIKGGYGLSKDDGKSVFVGWRVVGGDTTLYSAGNIYVMDGVDVELLAQYAQAPGSNIVTFTYKQNASSVDTNQEYWGAVKGATVTYPDADFLDFKKLGYTFAGWSTVALATEADAAYEPESSDTVTATTTLYAVWTANNYTLNFNANGGIDGSVLSKQVKYDSNVGSLPSASPQIPTRTGYTFTGWSNIPGVSNSADFTSAYVVNWTNTPKIVYAVWSPSNDTVFKVEHYLVGADGNANLKETTKHASTTNTTANAIPNTYIHYTHDPAHLSAVASGIVAADGSLVLKLYYSINRNSVSYNITGTIPEGAPNAPDGISDVAYGTNVNVATALSYTGYTFSGWQSAQVSGSSFSMPDEDVVFTGSWTKDAEPPVVNPPVVKPPVVNPPTVNPPVIVTPVVVPPTVESPNANPPIVNPPVVVTPAEEPIEEPYEPEAMPDPSTGTNEKKPVSSTSIQKKLDAQTGNPFTDLANGNVPLGGIGFSGAWSLLSLLMSLVAVVVSVLLVLGAILRRRDDGVGPASSAGTDSGARTDSSAYVGEGSDESRRKRGRILKIATIVVGILTAVVWIVLDDFSLPMVWVNKWTLYVGLVFIAHIVLFVVYKIRRKNNDDDEDAYENVVLD